MLKISIDAIKLDLDNSELNSVYKKYIHRLKIRSFYCAGEEDGLREISNNILFTRTYNEEEESTLYYNENLAMYFIIKDDYDLMKADGIELASEWRASYYAQYDKYRNRKLFAICKELADEDKAITARTQLLHLQKGKIFTK